jgi:hypothetical protein
MNIKDRIAQRKETLLAAAEYSDAAIDQLAEIELADETVKLLTDLCDKMHKLAKASNKDQWETNPKWEYGPVNGMIFKFLSQWVYLPDLLKTHLDLQIPVTAFDSNTLAAWGKLTRCTPLGQLLPSEKPDLKQVAVQVEVIKAYLNLPYTPAVMSQEQWEEKEKVAKIKADTKAAEIELALLEAEDPTEDMPVFQI